MAKLYFKYGAMGSSKTAQALITKYNYEVMTQVQTYMDSQLRSIVDDYNVPVMCFGLRTDFQTHLFPGSLRLMEVADTIQEIKTICDCGAKATVNARIDGQGHIVTQGAQVFLGGNDSYIAMCHKCYIRGIREHKVIKLHGQGGAQ